MSNNWAQLFIKIWEYIDYLPYSMSIELLAQSLIFNLLYKFFEYFIVLSSD